MRKRFESQVVVVTGGGDGIGKATSLAFAREGARIAVVGRSRANIDETVGAIRKQQGEAESFVADISKDSEVRALAQNVMQRFGRVDHLFNNAGIGSQGNLLCDVEEHVFDSVLAINTKGTWLCMKYFIPEMLKAGGGCIVNNASIAGLVGVRFTTPYCASKHAVIGLTKMAALEYGLQGIRVNAVCPATHESKMSSGRRERLGEEAWAKEVMQNHPATGRLGRVEDLAGVVMFLCSPEASNLHGVALPVDGGWSAQ